MKFYPESLKFMGRNREKYADCFNVTEGGGSMEVYFPDRIEFHFPLAQSREFYLTPHPAPVMKDGKKYTDMIDKAKWEWSVGSDWL